MTQRTDFFPKKNQRIEPSSKIWLKELNFLEEICCGVALLLQVWFLFWHCIHPSPRGVLFVVEALGPVKHESEASSMGSWWWASLTYLFMLIISTVEASSIQGILVITWEGESASPRLITSAYAHAYQATCLTRHMPALLHRSFRLPKPKARYPHLPNVRTTTRERSNDFQGWAIYTDGVYSRCWWWNLRWVECYRSISPWKNRYYVWPCRHHRGSSRFLRCQSSVQQHRWNDCYGWGFVFSRCSWPGCLWFVYVMTLNMLPVCAWVRFKPAHMFNWHLHVSGTATLGTWVMYVLDHAAALGAFGLVSSHNLATRWARHNFDTSACFGSCNYSGEALEKLRDIWTETASLLCGGS